MKSQWLADHKWVEWIVACARLIPTMLMRYLVESQLFFLVTLANCHLWETALCIQTNHQHIVQLFMQKAIVHLSLLVPTTFVTITGHCLAPFCALGPNINDKIVIEHWTH